jgi:site-specific recombinase XerC
VHVWAGSSRKGGRQVSAPTVRQQPATLRHLFDWLVTGQVVPVSPAASVRGPCHLLRSGKTAVLEMIHVQYSSREGYSLALLRLWVPIRDTAVILWRG